MVAQFIIKNNLKMENRSKYKFADRIMDIAFAILSLTSLAISPIYDTFSISIPVISMLLGAYYLAKLHLLDSLLYQYIGSACSALFTALLIYQMHGMIEMHFVAFIASILLINYKKWQLQLPLTLLVVVHHAVLAILQFWGYSEVYFTTSDYMDLQTFLIHVSLAAVIFFLCGYWAYELKITHELIEQKNHQFQVQIDDINRNVAIANEISKGNYDINLQAEENNELGIALITMKNSLSNAKKREEEERYINLGLAQSAEILRNNTNSLQALCDASLVFLIKYLSANQGGIFIVNDTNTLDPHFELVSCYAYDRKKYHKKKILINEGLVGACYLEKDIIYLTKVPEEYIRITSGLGFATPRCLLIYPLIVNDIVYGVIEMAFFEILEEYKISFIKKISQNIASTISTVKINEKTKQLLEASQQQAEEMRAQEEEMRQNMEELQAIQEEMTRKQDELTNELNNSKTIEARMKMQEEMMQQGMEELMTTQEEMEQKNKEIEKMSAELLADKESRDAKIEMLELKIRKKDKEIESLNQLKPENNLN
ncbi:MAG: hypothetical protein EAZ53_04765 [Bacteroidetes bacterium]|nr:MAG: hypothetical protein EAZ53_04765 [Bacteroidota bacterium]